MAQAAAYMKRLCEDSAFYEQKKAEAGAYIREKTKMQHSVSLLEDRLGKYWRKESEAVKRII